MKMKKIISMVSAAVIAASMSAVTAIPASAAANTSWKTVYSKYLKEKAVIPGVSEMLNFSLCDFDQDGTPELILGGSGGHNDTCTVYTCVNGKLTELGDCGLCDCGEIYYDPSTKTISAEYKGQIKEIRQYKLANGKLTQTYYACADDNYPPDIEYKINEKTVAKAEYDKSVSEHKLSGKIRLGRTFSYRLSEIDCGVNGGKNYKTVYKKFLKGRLERDHYSVKFSLKDITGDNVPELFITDTSDWGLCDIFTFRDGRLQFLGNSGLRDLDGVKDTIGWSSSSKTMTFMNDRVKMFCTLKNGYLVQSAVFTYDSYENAYYLNGAEISKSKYDTELNKFAKYKFLSLGKQYDLTEKNINKALK